MRYVAILFRRELRARLKEGAKVVCISSISKSYYSLSQFSLNYDSRETASLPQKEDTTPRIYSTSSTEYTTIFPMPTHSLE